MQSNPIKGQCQPNVFGWRLERPNQSSFERHARITLNLSVTKNYILRPLLRASGSTSQRHLLEERIGTSAHVLLFSPQRVQAPKIPIRKFETKISLDFS